ncbi:tripartite tricarboxylate transporter TctB family protein [Thermovorax subterraneus]|nr:tripartite tricarboxylate transporter TctB family protein [Thermovorax subterraneus]
MISSIIKNEGIIFIMLGIIGLIDSLRLVKATTNEILGPGWYLFILSAILLCSSACYLIATYKKDTFSESILIGLHLKFSPAVIAIILLLLYSFAVIFLGYLISTIIFLILTMQVFGERSFVTSIIFGIITGTAFWFLFVYFANIPMP